MCELLGMSARIPATITLSLNEFAKHGGETGSHTDGWGVAFYEGPDANLVRESSAAAKSALMSSLRSQKIYSDLVISHIRKASQGDVLLKNTHPFRRELSGNVHVFAHNGNLPGIQEALPLDRREFMVPVGDTDSEHAFCLLMQRLHKASMTKPGLLRLDARIRLVTEFAHEISLLGPANFLYSDGDVLFVFGHIRTQEDGNCVAPGLHYRTVECSYGLGQSTAVSVELNSACTQTVTLVSTYPLHSDNWIPMQSNQLLVVRRGAVIFDQVDATTPRLLRSISGGL